MSILHIGMAVSSQDAARNLFEGIFGFPVLYRFELDRINSLTLLGFDATADVIVYDAGNTRLEVFIPTPPPPPHHVYNHLCLTVADVEAIVKKAELAGYQIRRITKESRLITFIVDHDGNLYEVKPIE